MDNGTGHADRWTALDPEAALLMWRDGMNFTEIARVFDYSPERVRQIVARDAPDDYREWREARAIKRVYKATCPECGGRKAYDSLTCRACTPPPRPAIWTREVIIERIQSWNETYGSPPAARDWSPAMARLHGREDIARRFEEDGCWPSATTVQYHFDGKFSQAIAAAGFTPRATRGANVPVAVSAFGDAA